MRTPTRLMAVTPPPEGTAGASSAHTTPLAETLPTAHENHEGTVFRQGDVDQPYPVPWRLECH
ncbi:MAG TPA: hypothetical protein VGR26_17315 [Acidimicrobiales bacterium]|nr:hypothetical protein [Acidimicrobiales bacterium]